MTALSTTEETTFAKRYASYIFVVAMAAIMWVSEGIDVLLSGRLDQYGIRPRDVGTVEDIFFAPFLHGNWEHLIGNTIPFIILGLGIAVGGLWRVIAVTVIVAVIAGLGTWLIAPASTNHIGASGVVFGYATYLIFRAAFSRSWRHLVFAVIVCIAYGQVFVFGLIPQQGISWQGHLFGAIGGIVAAGVIHRHDRKKKVEETSFV